MALVESFSFKLTSNESTTTPSPRIGHLCIPGRKDLRTPSFIAITSRGVIPHMTPDILATQSHIRGVHLALEDFVEKKLALKSTPPILLLSDSISPIHTFTSLPSDLLTILTPRRTPAISTPNSNTDTDLSIYTSTGFSALSQNTYISACRSLRPDIVVPLADIAYNVIPGAKRRSKMGDRTMNWLQSHISFESVDEKGTAVFAPVLPIDSDAQAEYWEYVAEEAVARIRGLAFYDTDSLTEIPATSAMEGLVRLSLDEPKTPGMVLREVGLGVDLFVLPFVGEAGDGGFALGFAFPVEREGKNDGLRPLGVDMWLAAHSTSLKPLMDGCVCYTCTNHHRAYVQHLLSAKEMLGWVLLQVHNHAVMGRFFEGVRESVVRGTFERDSEDFERMYESELPEASGKKPRIRGYMFKTEGPGKAKRNAPAWGNLSVE